MQCKCWTTKRERNVFFFSIFLDDIMAGTHSSEEKNGTNSWRMYKTGLLLYIKMADQVIISKRGFIKKWPIFFVIILKGQFVFLSTLIFVFLLIFPLSGRIFDNVLNDLKWSVKCFISTQKQLQTNKFSRRRKNVHKHCWVCNNSLLQRFIKCFLSSSVFITQ